MPEPLRCPSRSGSEPDDASVYGAGEAIATIFRCESATGDGTIYWNGEMRAAFAAAHARRLRLFHAAE
jgi:hypothetical protein